MKSAVQLRMPDFAVKVLNSTYFTKSKGTNECTMKYMQHVLHIALI